MRGTLSLIELSTDTHAVSLELKPADTSAYSQRCPWSASDHTYPGKVWMAQILLELIKALGLL